MSKKFGLINPQPIVHVPHWSAMAVKYRASALPPTQGDVDYLQYLPDDLGMMRNDVEGDCFWAAQYHKRQLDTRMITGTMVTEPDETVGGAYMAATGFNGVANDPSDAGTDPNQGFEWIKAHGLPTSSGPLVLSGAFEIDQRNYYDCIDALDQAGGLCCGFTLPQAVLDNPDNPLWDYHPGDAMTNEGHEVFVASADARWSELGFVSWGRKYKMTRAFWDGCCNQVTAVLYADWVHPNGLTPFNLTLAQCAAELAARSGGPIP